MSPARARMTAPAKGKARAQPQDGPARATELARLERLGHALDAQWRVPGTGFRVGIDGMIGLIPGIGDTLAALPSAYIILCGWQLGARRRTLARMAVNTGVDYVIGMIPLLGDLFDFGFKANLRNLRLLREEFGAAAWAEG